MSYQVSYNRFESLSSFELYDLIKQRVLVFVVEQNCPYPELDDLDTDSGTQHVMITNESTLCAYARCLAPGVSYDEYASIGRVLVTKPERGNGLATKLMQAAITQCQTLWPQHAIKISAQCYLLTFYQGLGFQPVGEAYLEDDIPHHAMILTPQK